MEYNFDKTKKKEDIYLPAHLSTQTEILETISRNISNLEPTVITEKHEHVTNVEKLDTQPIIDAIRDNKPDPIQITQERYDDSKQVARLLDIRKLLSVINDQVLKLFQSFANLPIQRTGKKTDPSVFIPVRLTNGKDFYNAIDQIFSSIGEFKFPFRTSSGEQSRGLVDNDGHMQVDIQTMPEVSVNLEASDIEIGAVEIKNSTDDTRATVGANGLYVDIRNINGDVSTIEKTPTTFGAGQQNVTTAGTEIALPSNSCLAVTVKAKSTNTGLIYVGDATVSSTTGFILSAGESMSVALSNTNKIYIDSSVNGEGVSFTYIAT